MSTPNGFSPTLQHLLRQTRANLSQDKSAFVDPSMMAGGGGGGGMDPMAGGGGGMDPMAGGGGMDPMAGGGDPMAGGGGGGFDPSMLMPMIQQAVQAAVGGGGGAGAAGGAGVIKPKIDVNIEIMMIKKMLARICDALQIHIPASEMAVTGYDLSQMASQQAGGGGGGGMGGGMGGGQGAIPPIDPMQPATKSGSESDVGEAWGSDNGEAMYDMAAQARATALLLSGRQG